MRTPELYAYLGLGVFLALIWLGWLFWGVLPAWLPAAATGLAVLLLMVRIVLISVRQD